MLPSNPLFIDLTHPVRSGAATYPGDPPCRFSNHARLEKDGFRVTVLTMGSHHGTHVDAPAHFIEDGAGIEQITFNQLCGPAHVLDLTDKGTAGSVIQIGDLKKFAHVIVPGSKILLKTGWDARYNEPNYFTDAPGLSADACEWLAARSITLLGLDLPTLHPTEVAETHIPLLSAGTVIVESLKLSDLGNHTSIDLYVAPLPLAGLDGSPARAFAVVPSDDNKPAGVPASAKQEVQLTTVRSATDMVDALHIRQAVFVREQGVDPDIEWDALDRTALHLLASKNGTPVGTLRLVREGTQGTVGRFAVLKAYRDQGIGRAMIQWVIDAAPGLGLTSLKLNAQETAAGFYERAGFRINGPRFMEAGIPHFPMVRPVP